MLLQACDCDEVCNIQACVDDMNVYLFVTVMWLYFTKLFTSDHRFLLLNPLMNV